MSTEKGIQGQVYESKEPHRYVKLSRTIKRFKSFDICPLNFQSLIGTSNINTWVTILHWSLFFISLNYFFNLHFLWHWSFLNAWNGVGNLKCMLQINLMFKKIMWKCYPGLIWAESSKTTKFPGLDFMQNKVVEWHVIIFNNMSTFSLSEKYFKLLKYYANVKVRKLLLLIIMKFVAKDFQDFFKLLFSYIRCPNINPVLNDLNVLWRTFWNIPVQDLYLF